MAKVDKKRNKALNVEGVALQMRRCGSGESRSHVRLKNHEHQGWQFTDLHFHKDVHIHGEGHEEEGREEIEHATSGYKLYPTKYHELPEVPHRVALLGRGGKGERG